MSYSEYIQLFAGNVWLYGGSFLLILSILVFVHEWGHYIVARMCGVRVQIFSIGFGRELFGFNDKHGTRWKFSLIPLGGYVQMYGDTDPASAQKTEEVAEGEEAPRPMTDEERKVAFFSKPVSQRAAIVAAGPLINFAFAIILLAGLYMTYGKPVTPAVIGGVLQGSPAYEAGFQPGDEIIAIDGSQVTKFEDVRRATMIALDTPMDVTLRRGDEIIDVNITPERLEERDRYGFVQTRGRMGILNPSQGLSFQGIETINGELIVDDETGDAARAKIINFLGDEIAITLRAEEEKTTYIVRPTQDMNADLFDSEAKHYNSLLLAGLDQRRSMEVHNPLSAVGAATVETGSIIAATMRALGQMIVGTRTTKELGGVIRIGAIAGDMAAAGLIAMITFTAILSINLGLINLFPIPLLDGGHLTFYAIEAAKGSPLSDTAQEYAFRFGLVFLIGLMVYANLNDLVHLIF